MFICKLCGKIFNTKFNLDRHKNNRKISCDVKKEAEYNCKYCNVIFKYKSDYNRHEKTKKHITNYNIHIDKVNIENFNVNIIGGIKTFSETCLNVLSYNDIEYLLQDDNKLINMLKDIKDDDELYGSSEYIINSFNFFIKIFSKLNFNLAYTKNHNCAIYSFTKLNNNYIEYHLLEIDNINKQYTVEHIEYKKFIEEFINLMIKVNNSFKNDDFKILLDYIKRYDKMIYSENTQITIENILYSSYSKFKEAKKNISEDEKIFLKDRTEARANSLKNFLTNF
jgi:hypothetical protein